MAGLVGSTATASRMCATVTSAPCIARCQARLEATATAGSIPTAIPVSAIAIPARASAGPKGRLAAGDTVGSTLTARRAFAFVTNVPEPHTILHSCLEFITLHRNIDTLVCDTGFIASALLYRTKL